MRWLIRQCSSCMLYTLKEKCPKCGTETRSPQPAKFSPSDKYAKYKVYERESTDEDLRERREDSAE